MQRSMVRRMTPHSTLHDAGVRSHGSRTAPAWRVESERRRGQQPDRESATYLSIWLVKRNKQVGKTRATSTPQLDRIYRLTHWAYSQPTILIPQRKGAVDSAHFIESANGVRQGDPLSSLLFCLYLKPAIDALTADPVFGNKIDVYAYIDDVHIVGDVDDVLAARDAFVRHLKDIELAVNPDKCTLLYFHNDTHPLTREQQQAIRTAGLQWDEADSVSADVLGAVIGVSAAAIARRLDGKFGASGLFGAFFRRVRSGGFSVQVAMLLLAHSVSRMSYLQRCLPPEALERVATEWDGLLLSAATHVLAVSPDEETAAVVEALQRPRRLGGFGLTSAVIVSPFAFIASVAASAAQTGGHPLSHPTLPAASPLHQWLRAALTCPAVDVLRRTSSVVFHTDADTFTGHYHANRKLAAGLQAKLTTAATNLSYNARVGEAKEAGDQRGLARLYGGSAKYASRWKVVRPTEKAYELPDEYYRYAARRDLGLRPTQDRVLPRRCAACGMGVAPDGLHGQRCIYSSTYTKLRHDSIEVLLHDTIRDGVGQAYRQQHNLPAAERTIPDLLISLDNKMFLCDVTVVDTLAETNLATAGRGAGWLADEAAERKVAKYQHTAEAMGAVHLPFAVETTGGLSKSAQQLIAAIQYSAGQHCTWREQTAIGAHLVNAIAIAVQRCTGLALRVSLEKERRVALGVVAA